MDYTGATGREYAIQVSAVPDATGLGYSGQVVVQQLPEMCELLREEVLASGRLWSSPDQAVRAAYAHGRRFLLLQLCRTSAARMSCEMSQEPPARSAGRTACDQAL